MFSYFHIVFKNDMKSDSIVSSIVIVRMFIPFGTASVKFSVTDYDFTIY